MSSLRTENLLSIGELARLVDTTPSALRYWERAGLIDGVQRDGGRRRYRPDTVERIGLIRLCQDAGFGIGEIRALLAEDPHGQDIWRESAEDKLTDIEAHIARLQSAAELLRHTLSCPRPSLAECPTFTAYVHHRATNTALGVRHR
jgi:DNA-binding transcriptional MerR regulator